MVDIENLLAWAQITPEDEPDVRALLQTASGNDAESALDILRDRLGKFGQGAPTEEFTELDWLKALLLFIPEQVQWYQERGIPEHVGRATIADIGRHVAISRVTQGHFGVETWRWLTEQASGTLFQLGRLHFQLIPGPAEIPGLSESEAILGVHIPEAGPLLPALVDDSFEQAGKFFATYFAERPVRFANCISWLLDPYLVQHLPADSNIAAFARRFTRYGKVLDSPADAVYFTFRTRNLNDLSELPRKSALQRIVLERIDAGGAWQVGQGFLKLPALSSLR